MKLSIFPQLVVPGWSQKVCRWKSVLGPGVFCTALDTLLPRIKNCCWQCWAHAWSARL